MMGGGAPQQAPQQTQAPDPFDNPFGKVLKDMFGGGQTQPQSAPRQQAPQQNPYGDNPLGKIFEEMLGGSQTAAPEPQRRQPQQEQANPSGRPKNPYDDLFGKMFETGRQQRDDYQKGVESIFDQFSKGMDRYR